MAPRTPWTRLSKTRARSKSPLRCGAARQALDPAGILDAGVSMDRQVDDPGLSVADGNRSAESGPTEPSVRS